MSIKGKLEEILDRCMSKHKAETVYNFRDIKLFIMAVREMVCGDGETEKKWERQIVKEFVS